jgi:hypothetical protein
MVPEPVGFSFETPGWYVLLVFILILTAFLFVKWLLQYRKNAYRRAALKELDNINTRVSENPDRNNLNDLLILLKRVSIKTYGRAEVASLSGSDWFVFLEKKGKDTPYTHFEKEMNSSVYGDAPVGNESFEEISTLSRRWIKTHA